MDSSLVVWLMIRRRPSRDKRRASGKLIKPEIIHSRAMVMITRYPRRMNLNLSNSNRIMIMSSKTLQEST